MRPSLGFGLLIGLLACGQTRSAAGAVDAPDAGPAFDDHTVPLFPDAMALSAWIGAGEGVRGTKFVLTRFPKGPGEMHYMDPTFYALHDEWYWFRLLNGQPVDGGDELPVPGHSYPTIEAIYKDLRKQKQLPLGLGFYDGRLASLHFYNQMLEQPRHFGGGGLQFWPAAVGRRHAEALWLFTLEAPDEPSRDDMAAYFSRLEATLPPEIGAHLFWLSRGTQFQDALVTQLRQSEEPWAHRLLREPELIANGAVAVRRPGIAAGQLRRVTAAEWPTALIDPWDVVLLDGEVSLDRRLGALLTRAAPPPSPLTAGLSARGTPEATASAASGDLLLGQWRAAESHVIVQVLDAEVRWQRMTPEQWSTWLAWQDLPTDPTHTAWLAAQMRLE